MVGISQANRLGGDGPGPKYRLTKKRDLSTRRPKRKHGTYKRRFANAIQPNEAKAFPWTKAKRNVVENLSLTVGRRNVLNRQWRR